MADVARLKQELKAWERNFRDQHGGRAPSKEDTKKDAAIAAKYKLYRSLPKTSSSTTDSVQVAKSNDSSTSISGPSRRDVLHPSSLASLPKTRPIESPEKASTFNPFSPTKQSSTQRNTARPKATVVSDDDDDGSVVSNQIESNPFLVSPSKGSALRRTSIFLAEQPRREQSTSRLKQELSRISSPSALPAVNTSPATTIKNSSPPPTASPSTPQKSYHFATSPQKLKALLASSSASGRIGAPAFTPRTKARKRMRGEEIPYTPSEGRRNKRSRADQGSRISRSGTSGSDDEHLRAQTSHSVDNEVDELPESPVKPRRGDSSIPSSKPIFRPIFDELDVADPPTSLSFTKVTQRSAALSKFASGTSAPSAPLKSRRSTVNATSSSIIQESCDDDGNAVMGTGGIEVGPEHTLHPPSPPHNQRQTVKHANRRLTARSHTQLDLRGLPDEDNNPSSLDQENVVDIRNLAWGRLAKQPLQTEQFGLVDDHASGIITQPRRTQSLELVSEEDLDLSGNLRETLTISVPADVGAAHEAEEDAAWHNIMQGRQDLPRAAAGEIWDVGEIDDDAEDWDTEPEGWNASPDL